jgi:hypothetical protein
MNDEYRPTFGSTPAINENAIASGIKAKATTKPASTSFVSSRGDLRAAITELLSGEIFVSGKVCKEITF